MTEPHRPWCEACPWRDLKSLKAEHPTVVAHAEENPDGFVCHTRMGPCDGPRISRVAPLRTAVAVETT